MIHYHGTPVSTNGKENVQVKLLTGRHALIPFPRQDDLSIVSEVCKSFVFDNGAFSIWKKGGKLDVDKYTRWVGDWNYHPRFDWALIPDIIDGSEEDNDCLLSEWPKDLKGVPVYHLHESFDRLEYLIHEYKIIALGSSGNWSKPGTEDWWERMSDIMKICCFDNGYPKCKLHGLRMLDPKIFGRLPLSSADSTNAARNCTNEKSWKNGNYRPMTVASKACVIADRIEFFLGSERWCKDAP